MTDIVERLRASADEVESFPHPSCCDHLHCAFKVMREAAAEIERLRAAVPTDQTIIEAWDSWPHTSITSRARAVALVRHCLAQPNVEHQRLRSSPLDGPVGPVAGA